MTELKTLKEIEFIYLETLKVVTTEALRQEAIKHIKAIQDDKDSYEYYSDGRVDLTMGASAKINYIMWFNNIKEEELQ